MISFNKFLKTLHLLVIRPINLGISLGGIPIIGPILDPPDPPPAPDFVGAAEATAESQAEAAKAALEANRYDIFSPLGTQTWTAPTATTYEDLEAVLGKAPMGGEWDLQDAIARGIVPEFQEQWKKSIELSPEGQELFDKNISTQLGMADIGLMGLDQVRGIFSEPFQLDDFEGYREDVYDAMLDRVERDIDRDWETKNAQLYAAGIGRDTEAYGREREMTDRARTDARLQAYQKATDQALRERNRVVEEALLERQTPLNELNAFKTSSQVAMPTFETQAPMQTPAGANYLGAAGEAAQYDLAGYNADVMAQNQLISGLFSLGAGGLAGGYF